MNKNSIAEEHYKTEQEMRDELTELYGTVKVAYAEVDAGRFLQDYDEPFFNSCISDSMQWECPNCNKVYDDEDSADECCAEFCDECGERTDQLFIDKFGEQCTCTDDEDE